MIFPSTVYYIIALCSSEHEAWFLLRFHDNVNVTLQLQWTETLLTCVGGGMQQRGERKKERKKGRKEEVQRRWRRAEEGGRRGGGGMSHGCCWEWDRPSTKRLTRRGERGRSRARDTMISSNTMFVGFDGYIHHQGHVTTATDWSSTGSWNPKISLIISHCCLHALSLTNYSILTQGWTVHREIYTLNV